VSPRKLVAYQTMDELVRDNFKFFTRITMIDYKYTYFNSSLFTSYYKAWLRIWYKHWFLDGKTEVGFLVYYNFTNYTDVLYTFVIHPDTVKIFQKSVELPIVSYLGTSYKYSEKRMIRFLRWVFWNDQNKLIAQDLQNCSKTAWIIPKYLAQDISGNLIKSGKHSDVGNTAYSKPYLYLSLSALLPLSLLNRYSRIYSSGLVEWWPTFINETYLRVKNDPVPLAKPNMKGHTQVIFYILCSGLSVALCSIIVELSGKMFKFLKRMYLYLRLKLIKCFTYLNRNLNPNAKGSVYDNNL